MSLAKGLSSMVVTRGDGIKINLNQAVDSLTCFVETKPLDFGKPELIKFLDHLIVGFTDVENGINNLQMKIYSLDKLGGTPELEDTIDLSSNPQYIPVRITDAPYHIIRIEDNGIQSIWKLSSLRVFGEFTAEVM